MKNVRTKGSWSTFTKKGRTYHRFVYYFNNERVEFYGKTQAEVQKKVNEFENSPKTKAQKNASKLPFSKYAYECATQFSIIRRDETIGPNQMETYRLLRLKDTMLGKTQLGSITPQILTKFLMDMRDKNYSRKTINGDFAFIKRCLARAYDEGLINKNPGKDVAPLKEDEVLKKTKKVVSLEVEDLEKLLIESERINTIDNPINGPIGTKVYGVNSDVICFLIGSGLRIGECLALTWNDIIMVEEEMTYLRVNYSLKRKKEDDEEKATFYRGKTKTQCSKRDVALNDLTKMILEKQKQKHPNAKGEDYIFQTDTGNPISYHNVSRTLTNMLERAHCSNLKASPHYLRHSFGSYIIAKGGTKKIYSVSKLLGHSDTRTTEGVYINLLEDDNIETSSIMNELAKFKKND